APVRTPERRHPFNDAAARWVPRPCPSLARPPLTRASLRPRHLRERERDHDREVIRDLARVEVVEELDGAEGAVEARGEEDVVDGGELALVDALVPVPVPERGVAAELLDLAHDVAEVVVRAGAGALDGFEDAR